MPIYMDLHIVPGITAKGVAQAHVLDLNIQEEFQCSCMTYWIDEANNSAFCLIEAPNENAVRELHKRSHGLMPYNIIEVNKDAVASFLGRLYDPEVTGVKIEELKIFNDPAYRCLVFIDITDPILLKNQIGEESIEILIKRYFKKLKEYSSRWGGEIAEHTEHLTSILCFSSSQNALNCALEMAGAFSTKEKEILAFKISLNAGMPVSSSDKIFGETIELGKRLLYTSKNHKVVVAADVKDIARRHFHNNGVNRIFSLTPADEKLLNKIFTILEDHSPNENFGIGEFCRVAGLSKSSLNRHVHGLASKSPNTLLKEFRLNKAIRLLKNGENISSVAFSAGFRNPSYFSKCFKDHFSLSPSEYLDLLRSRST